MAASDPNRTRHTHTRGAGPVARRLVYALVLIPIVPCVGIVGVVAIEPATSLGSWDEFRWFQLIFSVLWVGATILIWRRAIIWTLGKKWLTTLTGMIPFVQVIYGQPLWDVGGCGMDKILCLGQHNVSVGLWVWIAVWVWWGWEKTAMESNKDETAGPIRISPIARRIIFSLGSVPFLVGAFWIVAMFLDDVIGLNPDPVSETFSVCAVLAVAIWILIWRRAVLWSPRVMASTTLTALGCMAIPIALQWAFVAGASGPLEVLLSVMPIIGWGLWMAITVSMWPMQDSVLGGSGTAPCCLRCGYLLKGLCATRCPECGDEPTLDELWSAAAGSV